ncbi:hypothetical protein N0Y54_02285 [Nostoc punctiforme UO1]|uniref:hypothetical protein n=1 Tax=Nostoc punctiforme TaxID=272131 RepID=UPI0030AFF031
MNPRVLGLVLSIVGIGIAVATGIASVTIPEVRCFLKLECKVDKPYNFRLLVVTEESKALEGVEVFFIPSDIPPIIERTNSDGYVKTTLPKKGDIEVKLSKDGYETLTRTINLDIEERTRTFRLKKVVVSPTPPSDGTSPPVPPEKKCERTKGNYTLEEYYGEILVNRTFKKPDKRLKISTTNPYSVVCKIITNTGSLNFIYAIPDDSQLKKVKVSLYLDGKLSKSVEVNRGSLVPLSVDSRNISNYSMDYTVEDDETNPDGYLYMFTTSN